MNGLEMIIKEIEDEAAGEAARTIKKAESDAANILAAAKADSDAKAAHIQETATHKVADIHDAQERAVVLQRRQAILSAKQELLQETLDKALQQLYALGEEEYFALIKNLAKQNAQQGKGAMLLNERDLNRLPAGFGEEMQAMLPSGCIVQVSDVTRPIDGGFVLSYGGVELNCSFADMFEARREEFYDLIREILF